MKTPIHMHVSQAQIADATTHDMAVTNTEGWETPSGLTGHNLRHANFVASAILSFTSALLCTLAIVSPR